MAARFMVPLVQLPKARAFHKAGGARRIWFVAGPAVNAPVIRINHAGVGFHLPQSSDYIYGEILNVSNRPIESAVITATLVIISGSWPSTTY